MPRYPFYSDDYASDVEDLSYYGGRFDFVYPRVLPAPNRLPLWNEYAYPDHLYGPTDPDADDYQITTDPGGLTDEEVESLSDGIGYPKEQPSPIFPLDVAGRFNEATLGFAPSWEDAGPLNQYGGLPRETISANDGDLNPGLRAMLHIFQGTLTLAKPEPRQYWWRWWEEPTPFPDEALHQYWGQVDAYEYKWTEPGMVESPDVDYISGTLAGTEPYIVYKANTPFYYSGSIFDPNYMNDPTSTEGVLPLTHLDGDEVEVVNRFVRWKNSRFYIVAHPSDVPPISGDAEDDQQAHFNLIAQIGRIHLYDWEARTRKPKRRSFHRWIKKS